MAVETPESPLRLAVDGDEAATSAPATPRRRRHLTLPEDAGREILDEINRVRRERSDWTDQRVLRWAKLMGILDPKTYPWTNASNCHLPILLQYVLRQWADLHNAVLGLRPVIEAVATEPAAIDKVDPVTHILDHQVFIENAGAGKLDRLLFTFLWDGTLVSVQTQVKDWRTVTDVQRLPRAEGEPLLVTVMDALEAKRLLPHSLDFIALDPDGHAFEVTVPGEGGKPEATVHVEAYDLDDTTIEVELTSERLAFDGPVFTPYELDDVVVPLRSENGQPVSPENPNGAPWIATLERVTVDEVKRLKEAGLLDQLTDEDVKAIEAQQSARVPTHTTTDDDALKRLRDTAAGQAAEPTAPKTGETGWVTLVQWFGPRTVGDATRPEEVVVTLVEETETVARVRRLSEVMPGLPVTRPVADERFIPIPHRFYGLGLVELLESPVDLTHTLMNQNVDNATIANIPWGAVRSSSQLNAQPIRLEPGLLLPLDNPATDLHIPSFPQRDQTWSLNVMGILRQDMDRVASTSAMAFGQVPQGKASALRTTGTTVALLQQGAAQPQAILRRLMQGLKALYTQFHRLNTRFLAPQTRYRKHGVPPDSQDAYGVIQSAGDLDLPVGFEFEASLLKANRGLVAQALGEIMAVLVNPLMIQAGLLTEEQLYNLGRDYIRAQEQEPSRYLAKPAAAEGPKVSAEEAVLAVIRDQEVVGVPLEPLPVHYQKLLDLSQDQRFGFLRPDQVMRLRRWLVQIEQALAEAQRRERMAQAAQAFQQALQGGQGGGTPGIQAVPEMQTQMPTAAEAEGGAIGGAR